MAVAITPNVTLRPAAGTAVTLKPKPVFSTLFSLSMSNISAEDFDVLAARTLIKTKMNLGISQVSGRVNYHHHLLLLLLLLFFFFFLLTHPPTHHSHRLSPHPPPSLPPPPPTYHQHRADHPPDQSTR